ncbi:MAG: hypothetical protein RLZZ519_969 [Bacteroidota bacterium]|jgi:hypothetical protein
MKKLFVLFTISLLGQFAAAQSPSPKLWFGRLDLFHQDYLGEFSFGQLGVYDKVHIRPGFRLGIERSWVTMNHFRLYQDVMLGYYHNTYDERSWTLGTDLGVEWRIFKEFRVAIPFGIHYNNAKAIDVRYVYEGEKWVKAKNTDPAINRLQLQSGLNIGWRFLPESVHPIDVFANGNISLIGPWQPGSGIPVLVYKSAGVGLRVGI